MKRSKAYWLFLLPSLLGVCIFYVVPFLFTASYAVTENLGSQKFVGLRHFADTLQNPLFRQAAGNTLVFLALTVPLSMGLALLLALCLRKLKKGRVVAILALLVPLVVPSGTITYFWRVAFGSNGLAQKLLLLMGFPHEEVFQNFWTMGAIIVIFLWKNVSYNIVLFWSGLNWIPTTYYEQMAIEGAGPLAQFRHVTMVYLSPTTFVVLLMSIANSFKVFKEVYMLYGAYPGSDIYMLQHYMNNQFSSLNMQKLAAAAYILFSVVGLAMLLVFFAQKRVTDAYQ